MRKLRFIVASVLAVLLALNIGPMGQAVASDATTGDQAMPVVMKVAAANGGCRVCGAGDHAATAPSSCVTGICWNVPELSGANLLPDFYGGALISLGVDDVHAGISAGPDSRPPSSILSI